MNGFEALCNRAGAIRREIRDALKAAGLPYLDLEEEWVGVAAAFNLLAAQIALTELIPSLEGFEIPRPPDEEPAP